MSFLPIPSDAQPADTVGGGEHASTYGGTWYGLRDELVPYIGERAANLFAFAISEGTGGGAFADSLRAVLVDSGENVDDPQVTEAEQLLIHWGRLIGSTPRDVPAEMYERLEESFNPRLRLLLVAFAGQTVAANVVSAVGRIEH